jgi:hypothetical protein
MYVICYDLSSSMFFFIIIVLFAIHICYRSVHLGCLYNLDFVLVYRQCALPFLYLYVQMYYLVVKLDLYLVASSQALRCPVLLT